MPRESPTAPWIVNQIHDMPSLGGIRAVLDEPLDGGFFLRDYVQVSYHEAGGVHLEFAPQAVRVGNDICPTPYPDAVQRQIERLMALLV